MIEYRLLFPKQNREFDETDLTFTINHIRSRRPSIIYFILHCYDIDGNEILIGNNPVYTSPRGVIGTTYANDEYGDYSQYIDTLTIAIVEQTVYIQLELRTLGVSSENPLYFSELMLQEGKEFNGYHTPSELKYSHTIELPSNLYANLYDKDGNYLQVIRPNKESFNTNNLDKAQYTILAPHFDDEDEVDSHIAVFLEAINQTEQKIDVLR